MILLLQRVLSASVTISGESTAKIGPGILALVGVQPHDNSDIASGIVTRMLKYRIFGDNDGKMNLNLLQIGGDLLMVPQFTLAADTGHGLRPGFSTAAKPELGRELFGVAVSFARAQHASVQTGTFGADMQVSLVNDGPVTFWLQA